MIKDKTVTAIILAAGNSTRYNAGVNKNLETIDGHEVLWYSLSAFAGSSFVDSIALAVRESERASVEALAQAVCGAKKPFQVITGGASRQESVLNCLQKLDSDLVLIHDGARPFMRRAYIEACLEALLKVPGCTVAVPSKDTIKLSDDKGLVVSTTDRPHTWVIQTPQGFDRRILLDAHLQDKTHSATDDCMLLEAQNLPVQLVKGDYTNFKITTPEDIELMQRLLNVETFHEVNQ